MLFAGSQSERQNYGHGKRGSARILVDRYFRTEDGIIPNKVTVLNHFSLEFSHSLYATLPDGCKGANVTVDFDAQEVRGYIR